MKTDKAKSVNRFFKKNLLSLIFLGILFTGLIAALIQIQIQSDTRSKASLTAVDLAVIPANQTVQPGQLVSFNLSINTHAHTVTTAQLELTFNNTLFDFVSFTPGNALNEILIAGVAFSNKVYLTLGTKPVLVNPGPPPVYEIHPYTGTGILAVLKLKAKTAAAGTGQITFNPQTSSGTGTIILTSRTGNTNVVGDKTGAPVTVASTVTPTWTPTPSRTPTPGNITPTSINAKPGDANSDGRVDGLDYVIWLRNYNKSATGAGSGDFNGNGFVDGLDYVIWLNNYNS